MGGQSGSGTTVVNQQPPQLIPEGAEGYKRAQEFNLGMLENPPIYAGPRIAPLTPAQESYMTQTRQSFGNQPTYQRAGEAQVGATASGAYLGYDPWSTGIYAVTPQSKAGVLNAMGGGGGQATGAKADYSTDKGPWWNQPGEKEIQSMVSSASQPYLRQLGEDIIPQINSDFGLSGGGVENTREVASKYQAMDKTSSIIATDVIAPITIRMEELEQGIINSERDRMAAIAGGDADRATQASIATASLQNQYGIARGELAARMEELNVGRDVQAAQIGSSLYNAERGRMIQAAGMTPSMLGAEGMRLEMLKAAGEYERSFNQQTIDTARDIYEEPLYRQSVAAGNLAGMAGVGPGGATTMQSQSSEDPLGDATSVISTVAMVAAIAAKAMSSKILKENISPVTNPDPFVGAILGADVKRWNYKTDHKDFRIGPILEELPPFLRENSLALDTISLFGALILTIQHLENRIQELEANGKI